MSSPLTPHPAASIASIRWLSIAPWLILVQAARVSLLVRVLALAVAGVLITEAGWWIVDNTVLDDPGLAAPLARLTNPPILAPPAADFDVRADESFALQLETFSGPLVRAWTWATQPFLQMLRAESWRGWFGLLLDGVWAIAVWALFGGAIARIAALYLTQGETLGPISALRSAARRWPSTAGAPLLALAAILIVALPLMFAGLLARLEVLALLVGALWFLVLLGGIAIAVLAIGLALGWPLMWSTVAVERTDAFDAISRGYAYVFQRPLHALLFVVLAGLLGLLAQAAVTLIVDSAIDGAEWAFAAGAGEDAADGLINRSMNPDDGPFKSPEETAARMIRFWTRGLAMFAAAFPLAYLFSAAVGIYLLLRRLIDSADIGDVKFDAGEPQRGLPPIANDPATGIPRVVDVAAPADATATRDLPMP